MPPTFVTVIHSDLVSLNMWEDENARGGQMQASVFPAMHLPQLLDLGSKDLSEVAFSFPHAREH